MSAFVLQGFPTTSTRQSSAALPRDRLSLAGEDPAVDAQEVLALHALLARDGPDEQRPVRAAEGGIGVGGAVHAVEERERAVVELHADPVERGEGRLELEELQADAPVGPNIWPEAMRKSRA
jgi:hypothetical protein